LANSFGLKTYHRLEERISTTSARYPFSSRVELQRKLDKSTKVLLSANYYDSDLRTGGGNYLRLSAGAIIESSGNLSLTVKAFSRYYFSDHQLHN
jgi:hypothetical protein